MDMTGKLIIKAGLNDDIRRIPIHNEDITYDELILMMQRVFKGKLNACDEILIKYKDEDGDLITLSDDSDLAFAIQSGGKILKITLFVNSQSDGYGTSDDQKREIKRQLKCVQDCLNDIVRRLDGLDSESFSVESVRSPDKKRNEAGRERESRSSSRCSGAGNVHPGSKEFDPLTGGQKPLPQSIPPISGSPRSGTPGSAVSSAFLPTQGSPKHLQNVNSTLPGAPPASQSYQSQPQPNAHIPGATYQNAVMPGQQPQATPNASYSNPLQSQGQAPQQMPTTDMTQAQPQQPQATPYQNYQAPYQPYASPGQVPQQPQAQQRGAPMYYPSGYQQQPPTSGADVSQQQPQQPQVSSQGQLPYGQPTDQAPRHPAPGPNAQHPSFQSGPPGPMGPPGPLPPGQPGQNMYALGGLNSKQASYRQGYR